MTVLSTIITSHDEQYGPPDQPILDVSVVDDVVFFSISTYDETHNTTSTETIANISVKLEDLYQALGIY